MRKLVARCTAFSRFAALLGVAVALYSCDASNPVAPPNEGEGGTPPLGTYAISITTDTNRLVVGSPTGAELTITVLTTDNAQPAPDGTKVTISTTLGFFLDDTGEEVQMLVLRVLGGLVKTSLFAGTEVGVAEILAIVGDSTQGFSLNIVPPSAPPDELVAAFEAATLPEELTVIFTDTSTGSPTGWSWDFGDGGVSDEQNPTHEFPTTDNYIVTLTVVRGEIDTASVSQFVTVGAEVEELAADYTADVGDGTGLLVLFTDTSTGDPTSWLWDFGDGTCDGEEPPADCTEQNPFHTFPAPGEFIVVLTASNDLGSSSKSSLVTAGAAILPIEAAFSAAFTPDSLIVLFTDESLGTPVSWAWEFGDGATSVLQNPVHTYLFSDDYVVRLTITDAFGATDTFTEVVQVDSGETAPIADFTFVKLGGLTVKFTDTSSNAPTSWVWDFGDGTCGGGNPPPECSDTNPTHQFPSAGQYQVTLTVQNGAGVDSTTLLVDLGDLAADFTYRQNGCTAVFTDQSEGGPNRWTWDFGDTDCDTSSDCNTSELRNPTHDYSLPGGGSCDFGSYSVNLEVQDSSGDSAETTKTVTINPFRGN